MQRVAAYAVIIRDDRILLSRLAERLTSKELWTLPGGGLEHGEDPRDAVVREVHEETGLPVEIDETAHVDSSHQSNTWRQGRRADAHALRIVYDGCIFSSTPPIRGSWRSTARPWKRPGSRWAKVLDGSVPTVALVTEVLGQHNAFRLQRVAAYALVVRDGQVLLTRNSARGPHPGTWTLPGGGIDHGEDPRATVVREVREETGLACTPGEVIDVTSTHFEGTAPSGRREDFHALQVVFGATVDDGAPMVLESGGTTDAAAWVPLAGLGEDREVRELVHTALAASTRISP